MNAPFRSGNLPMTTQAAEGLMRRRWSVAEIEEMVKAGILDENERIELIGGEIVPMSPKGFHHETLKIQLNKFWVRRLPDEFELAPETTFRLSEDSFVEPDFVFYRTADGLTALSPKTALLAVELSDSSLSYDMGRKARLYAAMGVREVWVINALKLTTRLFRRPGIEGYTDITDVASDETLIPDFAPELAVCLQRLMSNTP